MPEGLQDFLACLLPPPFDIRRVRDRNVPVQTVHAVRHQIQPHVQRQSNRADLGGGKRSRRIGSIIYFILFIYFRVRPANLQLLFIIIIINYVMSI